MAHAFNITALQYVGGNDDRVWNINDPNHLADYRDGKYHSYDIFPVAVPINRPVPNWVYDITGRFNKYLGSTPADCRERSLQLYSTAWGWVQDSSNPMERPIIPHDDVGQQNTLVFQVCSLICVWVGTHFCCFTGQPDVI